MTENNAANPMTRGDILKFVVIPYLSLVILHLILAANLKVPIIWPDDYAYLFSAKFIAGHGINCFVPISELVGSVGYPVILTPLYKLFSNPDTIYKGAILINIILGSLFYVAIFHFLRNIFKTPIKNAFIISGILSFYPAYFLQQFYLYTDSISVVLIIFSVTSFYKYLFRKNLFTLVVFATYSSILIFINFRFMPFNAIAVAILTFMAYKKQISVFQAVLLILVLIASASISIYGGIKLSGIITGNNASQDFMISQVNSIFEIMIILSFISLILINIINGRFLYAIAVFAGFAASFARLNYLAFLIPTILFILTLTVLTSLKKLSPSKALKSLAFFITIFLIGFFVINIHSGFITYWEYISNWFINFIGTSFYANFASYGLIIMGVLFTVKIIYDESARIQPAITYTEVFNEYYEKKLLMADIFIHEKSTALTYLLVGSVFALVISIFPVRYMSTHFRADELFFGRFIELLSAVYFAIAMYKSKNSLSTDYLAFSIAAIVLFAIQIFVLLLVYGNFIYSELAVQSVFSFFPLRAVLGNINIGIFTIYAVSVLVVLVFLLRFFSKTANLLLLALFVGYSLFGYNYVVRYFQIEKRTNTILANQIQNYINTDEIQFDNGLSNETGGQNMLRYAFLLPDMNFKSVMLNSQKFTSRYIITDTDPDSTFSEAKFIGIEINGNGELWDLKPDSKVDNNIFPSYYNLPLLKDWVAGVSKYGVSRFGTIQKNSGIHVPLNSIDSGTTLDIDFDVSGEAPVQMKIYINNKNYYSGKLTQGVEKFSFDLDNLDLKYGLSVDFEEDFKSEPSETNFNNGANITSITLKNEHSSLPFPLPNNKPLKNNFCFIMPRQNINIRKIEFAKGDSIFFPLTISNNSGKNIDLSKDSRVVAVWRKFLLRNTAEVESLNQYDGAKIENKNYLNIDPKLKVPDQPGKYFLSFVIKNSDGTETNFGGMFEREYLISVH